MRSNQHSKRSRGRSRHRSGSSGGGGSGGNPLNRVYESNGPDVKVRGTAQTIAEKYLQLGRDAQASGDIVMSESYLQHAEHYLRILAAAQAYNQQMQQQYRRPGDDFEEDEVDDTEDEGDEMPAGSSEQPVMAAEPMADEDARPPQQQQQQQQQRQSRDFRSRDRDRDRHNRPRHDGRREGQEQPRDYQQRDQQPRETPVRADEQQSAPPGETVSTPSADESRWEAPSFLRKPTANGSGRPRVERKPRREGAEGAEPVSVTEPTGERAPEDITVPQGE